MIWKETHISGSCFVQDQVWQPTVLAALHQAMGTLSDGSLSAPGVDGVVIMILTRNSWVGACPGV